VSTTTRLASSAILDGARVALSRLRSTNLVLTGVAAMAAAFAIAIVHRQHTLVAAPSQTLVGVFRYLVPLSSFAIASVAVGRHRLDDSVWCLARHGVPKQLLAVGLVGVAAIAAAGCSVLCVGLGLMVAYAGDAGVWADLITSSWIAALGGGAYACWTVAGAAVFRLGRGRWLVLVADFTIGSGAGWLAATMPRAHLRSLIGGADVAGLDQPASSVMLLAMTLVVGGLAALRTGR